MTADDDDDEEIPTCSGKWIGGSGGHRQHEPCDSLATWYYPGDDYAYCDAHITESERGADKPAGYVEAPWAESVRRKP